MKDFSERLKSARNVKKQESSKWTQTFVANQIGVARTTYTAYENGTKQPPLETVNKISDVLNVSVQYLLGRTDNPHDENEDGFDPIAEHNRLLEKYGIEDSGFFDIEKWKEMGPEEMKQLESYFQFIYEQSQKKNNEE